MGTFIKYIDRSNGIPHEKRAEFKDRIKTLFQHGGMMDLQRQCLLGKEIITISPTDYKGEQIDFTYNYYEDRQWENAGFSLKSFDVYSHDVGKSYFNWVMSAGYVLQGLYSDGDFLVIKDRPVTYDEKSYISWINSLFDSHFAWKNWDRFKVVWMIRDIAKDDFDNDYHVLDIEPLEFEETDSYSGLMSCLEVETLHLGSDWMDKYLDEDDEHVYALIKPMREMLQSYKNESLEDEDSQIEELLMGIYLIIKKGHPFLEAFEFNDYYRKIMETSYLFTSPVILLKCISELYGKDFWELFDRVENFQRTWDMTLHNPLPACQLSQLLDIKNDDMIFLWKEDHQIQFSDELTAWFEELKKIFDNQLDKEIHIEQPLFWIMDLLEFACDNYVRIFAFQSFFEESLKNLNNQNYLILWKIFEEMCHDKDMLKNGKVIFINGQQPSNKNSDEWWFIDRNEMGNSARMKLKRYMALVANKELRKSVFGF